MTSLEIAEQAAREFEGRSFEARLGADTTQLFSDLANANRMGEDWDRQNFEAKLGADVSDVLAGSAQAAAAVATVPDRKTTTLDANSVGIVGAAAAASAAIATVPDRKTTTLDADAGSTIAAAATASAAVASVPSKKTTNLDADAGLMTQVVSRALGLLRSIPGRVQTVMSILGDPQTIIGHVRRGLMQVQNMPPTRIQMDSSQARQAATALNGTERAIRSTTNAMATLNNVRGADGSMWRRFGSALISASQAATRGVSAFLGLGRATATTAQAGANAATAMTATAASVANTGQAATAATAAVATTGSGLATMAASAALAAPALLLVAGAVVVLGGALGAVLAVIMPIVAGILVLVGALSAVAIGFALIGAAGLKLATDFGTVYAATQKVKDAQVALNAARKSGDTTRIAEAEKALARAQNEAAVAADKASGASKEYATQLQRMGSELDKLKSKFSTAFSGAATELARISANTMELAQQHLPALGTAAQQAVKQMEEGFKSGVDSSTELKDILDDIPEIMGNIAGTVANVGSAFTSFLDVAMPLIIQFTQYCEDLSEKLAEWADSQEGRDQIQAFLEAAVPIAQAFADGIAQVGEMLATLSNDHAPAAEAAVTLFFDAVSFGISVLDVLLGGLEAIIAALERLIGLAKDAAAALSALGGGGGAGSGGATANPTWAHGGDEAFADGGDFGGAHYVTGPTNMNQGGKSALYGEALNGSNREYAFPMDGGFRFITEQPGFDMNSFNLWADLGNRKNFFDALKGTQSDPTDTASSRSSSPASMSAGGGSGAGSNMESGGGNTGRFEHIVKHSSDQNRSQNTNASNGERRIEQAIQTMDKAVTAALKIVASETARIPERIKGAVDHNNVFDKNTRTSVLKGLSREASKGAFEGSLS